VRSAFEIACVRQFMKVESTFAFLKRAGPPSPLIRPLGCATPGGLQKEVPEQFFQLGARNRGNPFAERTQVLSRRRGHGGVNGRNSDNPLIQRYLHWEPDTTLGSKINISLDSAVKLASCTKTRCRSSRKKGRQKPSTRSLLQRSREPPRPEGPSVFICFA
jgi:hypothetical protein